MELIDRAQSHLNRMDFVVKSIEIKWGIMFAVLSLVPPELAEKFQRQWQSLNNALAENRHEDIISLTDGVIRGCWALDKAAMSAGNDPQRLDQIGIETPVMAQETPRREIKQLPPEFWTSGGDLIPF
jgi:hypothetical protein